MGTNSQYSIVTIQFPPKNRGSLFRQNLPANGVGVDVGYVRRLRLLAQQQPALKGDKKRTNWLHYIHTYIIVAVSLQSVKKNPTIFRNF